MTADEPLAVPRSKRLLKKPAAFFREDWSSRLPRSKSSCYRSRIGEVMAAFMKRGKKKQSSFTTLHGIILSLAIAALVGTIFVLIALFWRPPG